MKRRKVSVRKVREAFRARKQERICALCDTPIVGIAVWQMVDGRQRPYHPGHNPSGGFRDRIEVK